MFLFYLFCVYSGFLLVFLKIIMNFFFIKFEDVVVYSEDFKFFDCDNYVLFYYVCIVVCVVFYEFFLFGNLLFGNSMVR